MTEEIESNVLNDTDLAKLKEAVQFYYNESMRFKELIDTAKTKTKRNYYRKKLKDNNQIFSKYLYLYDKVTDKSNKAEIAGDTISND